MEREKISRRKSFWGKREPVGYQVGAFARGYEARKEKVF